MSGDQAMKATVRWANGSIDCHRRGDFRLYRVTARQQQLLVSLANDERTVSQLADDWRMTEAAARGRVYALERQGLVRRTRWDESSGRGAWQYGLTRAGVAWVDAVDEVGWLPEEGGA